MYMTQVSSLCCILCYSSYKQFPHQLFFFSHSQTKKSLSSYCEARKQVIKLSDCYKALPLEASSINVK